MDLTELQSLPGLYAAEVLADCVRQAWSEACDACRDCMDPEFLEKPKRWSAKFLGLYM